MSAFAETSWGRLVAKMIVGSIKEKAVELLMALSRFKLFAEGLQDVANDIQVETTMGVFKKYCLLEKKLIRSPLVKVASRYMRSLTALSSFHSANKTAMEESVKGTFPVDEVMTLISQFKNCKVVVFRK